VKCGTTLKAIPDAGNVCVCGFSSQPVVPTTTISPTARVGKLIT